MRVALVGNQNCGKTSLFNKLTGGNQKIGNWPGVTVDRKEGVIMGTDIEIIDLPGVYSLSPYTDEENITRNYLLDAKPDVVVNVVDSTILERSLYLTTQIMDLGVPIVLALNMVDLLQKKKCDVNEKQLSLELGVDAVKVSARTGCGVSELIDALKNQKTQNVQKYPKKYPEIIEKLLINARNHIKTENSFAIIEKILDASDKDANIVYSRQVLEKLYGKDLEQNFIELRYKYIEKIKDKCFIGDKVQESTSNIFDKVLLNKYLAIPIFLLVMSSMYFLSVGVVGRFASDWLNVQFAIFLQRLKVWFSELGVSAWLVSLLVGGILTGVTSVLSFLPQLVIIFLCISLLESSGYMSRVVFIFDKLFYRLGLSGKSLISFIVGSGCSVPAISATRTIEQEQEKQKTILLSPFIPCSAKLPIISLFVGEFFSDCTGFVTMSLYFLAGLIIVLSAIVLNKFFFKTKNFSFVSELPDYKLPSVKYTLRDVSDRCKDFILRAGTIIVLCSIVIWCLSSFSLNFRFCDNISESILAKLGNIFSWFFYPIIGEFNWAVTVSAIQGLIAKEQVVSSMSIIASLSGGVNGIFTKGLFANFNAVSAYAFVVFNLFSAPCLASIGAMKNELKSTKKALFAVCFQIAVAWIVSSLIFQVGRNFI